MSKMLTGGERHACASPPWLMGVILISSLAMGACTMAKPPAESLSKAELAVRAAAEAKAADFAPMDLQSAREKLDRSKQAMAGQRYEDARRLAERAQVEAELAEVKAEAEIMRYAAVELRKRIDVQRMENELGSRRSSTAVSEKE